MFRASVKVPGSCGRIPANMCACADVGSATFSRIVVRTSPLHSLTLSFFARIGESLIAETSYHPWEAEVLDDDVVPHFITISEPRTIIRFKDDIVQPHLPADAN
jgi:hypothetical protein